MSPPQIPFISAPLKYTTSVDWKQPLERYIAQVYQEDPGQYENELAAINRLRQDIQGAGKDRTGRDLFYRYFGQLELLDLRFIIDEKHVKIPFTWHDAFSGHPTTQFSLAYEKASVIFNFAATLSYMAVQQNHAEASEQRQAYNFFRASAGMFQYINDNFLHAPSMDLSRDIIKLLSELMLAQAQECILEKSIQDTAKDRLIAKLASYTSWTFGSLVNSIKDHMPTEKTWLQVCEIKEKYYQAVAEQYQAVVCASEAKYGEQVRRLLAAKDASTAAATLTSQLPSNLQSRGTLRSDTSAALQELCKTMVTRCTEMHTAADRDNNMIYHDHHADDEIPKPIDRKKIADTMKLTDIYGPEEARSIVGNDIFARLIPLEVHQSASRYSEKMADMIREMTEKCDLADAELKTALDYMKLPDELRMFKQTLDCFTEPPASLCSLADKIAVEESKENGSLSELKTRLQSQRDRGKVMLEEIELTLVQESKEGNAMGAKYGDQWTLEPIGFGAATYRQDVHTHHQTLQEAAKSDLDALKRYDAIEKDINILKRGGAELENYFAETIMHALEGNTPDSQNGPKEKSILDSEYTDGLEQKSLSAKVEQVETLLDELRSVEKEEKAALQKLKEKCKNDDISRLLVLNKREENVEKYIFTAELEKFRDLRQSIDKAIDQQQQKIQKVSQAFKVLMEDGDAQKIRSKWDLANTHHRRLVERLMRSGNEYQIVLEGLRKGALFYTQCCSHIELLVSNVKKFTGERARERVAMMKSIESSRAEREKKAKDSQVVASPSTTDFPVNHLERATRQMSIQDSSPYPVSESMYSMPASTSTGTIYSQQSPISTNEPRYSNQPTRANYFETSQPTTALSQQQQQQQQQTYHERQQSLSQLPPQQSLSQQPPPQSLSQPPPQHSLSQPPPQHSLSQPPPQHSLSQPPPQHSLSQPPPQHSLSQPPPPQQHYHHPRQTPSQYPQQHSQPQYQQQQFQSQPYLPSSSQYPSIQPAPYRPQIYANQSLPQPYHHQSPAQHSYPHGQQSLQQQAPLPKPKEYSVRQQTTASPSGPPPMPILTGPYTPTSKSSYSQASPASLGAYTPPSHMPVQSHTGSASTPSSGMAHMLPSGAGNSYAPTVQRGPPVLQQPPPGHRAPPLSSQSAAEYSHAGQYQYHATNPENMAMYASGKPGEYYPPSPSHWRPPTLDPARPPPMNPQGSLLD